MPRGSGRCGARRAQRQLALFRPQHPGEPAVSAVLQAEAAKAAKGKVVLEARGITKRFQGLVSVNNVSFSLAENEILGVIGPNGAGKTTLVNMISGTLAPNEGDVVFRRRADRRSAALSARPSRHRAHLSGDEAVSRPVGSGQCRGRRALRLWRRRKGRCPRRASRRASGLSSPASVPVSTPARIRLAARTASGWSSPRRWPWGRSSCCSTK